MYRKRKNRMLRPHEFFLPFDGRLNENNRWCQLALLIPWDKFEDEYAKLFRPDAVVSVRMELGCALNSH